MGYRFTSARILIILIGIIALILAFYYGQLDYAKTYLTRFVREELAGYPA